MSIAHGHRDGFPSPQLPEIEDADPFQNQARGKGMPQIMKPEILDLGQIPRAL